MYHLVSMINLVIVLVALTTSAEQKVSGSKGTWKSNVDLVVASYTYSRYNNIYLLRAISRISWQFGKHQVDAQVGVVVFGRRAHIILPLNNGETYTKGSDPQYWDNLNRTGGGMELIRKLFKDEGRLGSLRILLIIDAIGESNMTKVPFKACQEALHGSYTEELRKEGVVVATIGINATGKELLKCWSSPGMNYQIKSRSRMPFVAAQIIDGIIPNDTTTMSKVDCVNHLVNYPWKPPKKALQIVLVVIAVIGLVINLGMVGVGGFFLYEKFGKKRGRKASDESASDSVVSH